ncbi:hypothetical protein [Dokdonella sp.]|uniref:hypothetical protein n=1 Tax=Dokdonella sp. TaxID=2291710 RepID=UPI0037851B85
MGLKLWFLPKPSEDVMLRMIAGLVASIHTPIVQTAKREIDEATSTLPSLRSRGILSLLMMQVSLLSALATIEKKHPKRVARALYEQFEKTALDTFELGDRQQVSAAFQRLKAEIGDAFGTESVDRINRAGLTLLTLACQNNTTFNGNQLGATCLASIKVWSEAEKFADIALLAYTDWKDKTAYDAFLRSSSKVVIAGYRSIAKQHGLSPSLAVSDYLIMETYSTICESFRAAAESRGERIAAEQLNRIALKFLQVREQSGDEFYREHLDYEIDRYLNSGLREDYQKGIRLFQ